MDEQYQINVSINLAGITDRIQRRLRASMSLVAIGLNARTGISTGDLKLPEVNIYQQFDSSNQWTVEQAGEAWQKWILENGFRDVAEEISGLLEETQSVLSHWQLVEIQKSRPICGEDWNEVVVNRGSRFHQLGLPDKIDFLTNEYGLALPDALVRQVLTINAARNCLVHREGVVTTKDTRGADQFDIEWSAMAMILIENGVEKEIEPPYLIKGGGQLAVGTRPKTKSFAVGQDLIVTAKEFSQICFTLFLFASTCAQSLEAHGKAQGIQFLANNEANQLPVEGDE